MKEKNKGFTLVELLAVIVILALIALIATPIILNVINDAKKQAALEILKGYIDGAEKAIALNELEDEEDTTFPKADENGCYDLNKLAKKINIKGTKPTIDSDAKVCFQNGEATSISGLAFNGYNVEYKNGKYIIDGKVVEKDDKKELTGIPSKEYTQGEKVSYLGYNWLVMKDNGDNTQLVMDGYLSTDELTANLPSDVSKQYIYTDDIIPMCTGDDLGRIRYSGTSGNYCKKGDYSWNTSIVKPTIENWLNNKMTEKGLKKETELKGMSFTDGVDTINSYVRLPLRDEAKSMNGTCDDGTPYCPDTNNYLYELYQYWLLDKTNSYVFAFVVIGNGAVSELCELTGARVRPVITVNEK